MNYYAYCTNNRYVLRRIDMEFEIMVVVGEPEDGHSDGFDIAIYDPRPVGEIAKQVDEFAKGPLSDGKV